MGNLLFVTWDGGGNVPPATAMAGELKRRGHRLEFLGHEGNRAAVEGAGLSFSAYEHALPYSSADANSPEHMVEIFNDPGVADDMVAVAHAIAADVVVIDCMMLAALGRARAEDLTYVPLEHLFDAYLRQGWLEAPFGQVADARGHDPFGALAAAPLVVAATLRELDPAGQHEVPANLLYSGPILDIPASRGDLGDIPPTVLLSFSTFNFPGQDEAMQTVLDALNGAPARVIVTTGPVIDGSALRVPDNVEMHDYIDHDALMPEVTLVIGHGGHATTMRALAHDLPVAAMPQHPLLDQTMVGRAIEHAGAGRLVPRDATATEVRTIIDQLLADGPHRSAAARLGKAIREARGAETAADAVEALLPS